MPNRVSHWSLRSIQLKLIKIGAKVISHYRRTVFQMAEVAVPGELFEDLLVRIRYLATVQQMWTSVPQHPRSPHQTLNG
ncbi:MAG: transposase [Actinobacteria bacterium]|nr:transposase [Actinomycetota bacterium]